MAKMSDERRNLVLRRLARAEKPLSILDLTHIAGAQTLRWMAARGFIKIEISLLPHGINEMKADDIRKARAKRRLSADALAERHKAWVASVISGDTEAA